jgi:SAM-dependent methyltransferase
LIRDACDRETGMMTAKEHYATHLANFYSWMAGDFEAKQNEFRSFLQDHGIKPSSTGIAIDLGAGHGLQSVPLAKLGFRVTAVDFNQSLLEELKINAAGLPIEIWNEDIREVNQLGVLEPELILCWGDTLTHLDGKKEIGKLIFDMAAVLVPGGKMLLSFRDYSAELTGDSRFIPVKSDNTRILTCVLDYEGERVRVTDLLQERNEAGWKQKVSSYYKVRISPEEVEKLIERTGMRVAFNQVINRMTTILAEKT